MKTQISIIALVLVGCGADATEVIYVVPPAGTGGTPPISSAGTGNVPPALTSTGNVGNVPPTSTGNVGNVPAQGGAGGAGGAGGSAPEGPVVCQPEPTLAFTMTDLLEQETCVRACAYDIDCLSGETCMDVGQPYRVCSCAPATALEPLDQNRTCWWLPRQVRGAAYNPIYDATTYAIVLSDGDMVGVQESIVRIPIPADQQFWSAESPAINGCSTVVTTDNATRLERNSRQWCSQPEAMLWEN